jgi:hypothetical protein
LIRLSRRRLVVWVRYEIKRKVKEATLIKRCKIRPPENRRFENFFYPGYKHAELFFVFREPPSRVAPAGKLSEFPIAAHIVIPRQPAMQELLNFFVIIPLLILASIGFPVAGLFLLPGVLQALGHR